VVANILAGPLAELADTLLHFLRPGGTLLMSGLLASQAPKLCRHYAEFIVLEIASEKDGWVCLRGIYPKELTGL
jgi:ribosomal protein L11 methyltransferase